MTVAVASKVSEAKHDKFLWCGPDIQTLAATPFDHRLASHEVVTAFVVQIGECTGLQGATFEDITLDPTGNTDPSTGCDKQGTVVGVATEELLCEDT